MYLPYEDLELEVYLVIRIGIVFSGVYHGFLVRFFCDFHYRYLARVLTASPEHKPQGDGEEAIDGFGVRLWCLFVAWLFGTPPLESPPCTGLANRSVVHYVHISGGEGGGRICLLRVRF